MAWSLELDPAAREYYWGKNPMVDRLIERRLEIARAIKFRAENPDDLQANLDFDDAVRATGEVNSHLIHFGVDINRLFVLVNDDPQVEQEYRVGWVESA